MLVPESLEKLPPRDGVAIFLRERGDVPRAPSGGEPRHGKVLSKLAE